MMLQDVIRIILHRITSFTHQTITRIKKSIIPKLSPTVSAILNLSATIFTHSEIRQNQSEISDFKNSVKIFDITDFYLKKYKSLFNYSGLRLNYIINPSFLLREATEG